MSEVPKPAGVEQAQLETGTARERGVGEKDLLVDELVLVGPPVYHSVTIRSLMAVLGTISPTTVLSATETASSVSPNARNTAGATKLSPADSSVQNR